MAHIDSGKQPHAVLITVAADEMCTLTNHAQTWQIPLALLMKGWCKTIDFSSMRLFEVRPLDQQAPVSEFDGMLLNLREGASGEGSGQNLDNSNWRPFESVGRRASFQLGLWPDALHIPAARCNPPQPFLQAIASTGDPQLIASVSGICRRVGNCIPCALGHRAEVFDPVEAELKQKIIHNALAERKGLRPYNQWRKFGGVCLCHSKAIALKRLASSSSILRAAARTAWLSSSVQPASLNCSMGLTNETCHSTLSTLPCVRPPTKTR